MALDRVSRLAGAHARYAYGSAIPLLGQSVTRIEDEAERRAFNQRVVAEFLSGQAPVGLVMYMILQSILLMT